jgi:uncharacterized protein YjiS (DUF1127 family)
MNTAELGQTIAATPHFFRFFQAYWATLRERRKRNRARGDLCGLNDRELMDIGIARGEIDYVAANPSISPRGVDIGHRVPSIADEKRS